VQGLATGVGIAEHVVSPTFTSPAEYVGSSGSCTSTSTDSSGPQEFLDLGLEDLADDAVLVVEWGDVAAGYLPADHLAVQAHPRAEAPTPTSAPCRSPRTGPSWGARQDAVAAALDAR